MNDKAQIQVMRSQLGRVRGTGAARSGVHHWYAERLTAIALVPLTLWFVFSVVRLAGASQATMVAWLGHPVNAVLMLALIVATFHHMQLGLQVVFEDYVNAKWLMNVLMLASKAVSALLALFAATAVLKLYLM